MSQESDTEHAQLSVENARYELKFPFHRPERELVETWLLMHPEGFVEHHPPRKVNSIYFDTSNYRAFEENLSGIRERNKYRLRWYGEPTAKQATFEHKKKLGMLGWKLSHKIVTGEDCLNSFTSISSTLREQLPPNMKCHYIHSDSPVVFVSYYRRYYCSTNRDIRITIDSTVSAKDIRTTNSLSKAPTIPFPDVEILEIKIGAGSNHQYDIARNMPLVRSKVSKYVVAVQNMLFQ